MILPLAKTTGVLYRHAIKPILFLQSPDRVHAATVRLGASVSHVPGVNSLLKSILRFDRPETLSQSIDGVHFPNPVGLAAGLDKNAELLPLLPAVGFGFSTIGSVTYLPCEGNPKPWYFRLPKHKSLVVHNGLANDGAEKVLAHVSTIRPKSLLRHPVVLSVAKTNIREVCTDEAAIADYVGSLKLLRDNEAVSIIEINISCPNTFGGEPFTDAPRLDQLLRAVDGVGLHQPVWIKMPINLQWDEFNSLLDVIVTHSVQSVTIGNLNKSRESLATGDLADTIQGNLSGLPTQALSDRLIEQTYRTYGDRLTIIGVGGVFSAEDAYRKICLGAHLVELITGVVYEGPQLVGQINRDIDKYLRRDGFTNISEAVGSHAS